MISLEQVEFDIKEALKARDAIAADTLRGLKVRIQNEKIAKMRDLEEQELTALVRSEIKRRQEAAKSFAEGGRQDSADKELREAAILEKYLPEQLSEQALGAAVDEVIAAMNAGAADFGKVMGAVKAKVGQSADGAAVARLVKEKLK